MKMKVLFVNSCIRGEVSHTARLCRLALAEMQALRPDIEVTELDLERENVLPMNRDRLEKRVELVKTRDFQHPMFRYARQLAEADLILVGAPYWDLSFPAVLKAFWEQVSVVGITFRYGKVGEPVGMCAAKELLYITTAGGYIEDFNFGFDYVKGLCGLYGIPKTDCIAGEGLDIIDADTEEIVQQTEDRVRTLVRKWKNEGIL